MNIFEHKKYRTTEFDIGRSIVVDRQPDGGVLIRISAESEGQDAVSLPMTLSREDADRLGRMLLCSEDKTFDEIISRAEKHGGGAT